MIIHVDMDAFYASVEERERPELVGRPVVVGGTPQGRGVVAAANYEARKYGVHSAMPAVTARRLCPGAVFLPVRMELYASVSRKIREIFSRYTPLVEPLSLDEAFLDVTGSERLFGTAETIGRSIKQTIRDELQLVASAGVAPNKFLAKIASDLDKPDGFVCVDPGKIQEFLDPLPIGRIWGVGRQSSKFFDGIGVRTIGQLRKLPEEMLQRQFGKSGEQLWQLARGVDHRSVMPDRDAKSISHETTFATDQTEMEVLRARLLELTEQVGRRLRRCESRGTVVQLKIRFSDFRTLTRSRKLTEPTDVTDTLWQTASFLLEETLKENHPPVRLLGIGVSGIDRSTVTQGLLFDQPEQQRREQLDRVTDELQERFGDAALSRGSRLGRPGKQRPSG